MYGWTGLQRGQFYEQNPDMREKVLGLINKTPRQIWIDVGNHMRQHDPDVWLNSVLNMRNIDVLIIKDLRFVNEFEQVQARKGVCIKVVRSSIPDTDDDADTPLAGETRWDYIVNNDADLKNLNNIAQTIVERFV